MKTIKVLVTPEIAGYYLSKNTSNRHARQDTVTYLANLITRGEWKLTHQGICINKDGVLVDGQHRLLAVVKAGIPVEMLVTTDAPNDIFMAIDSGLKRSTTDNTGIIQREAMVSSLLITLSTGKKKNSPQEIINMHRKVAPFFSGLSKQTSVVFSSAGFLASAVILCASDNRQYVEKSFNQLVNSDTTSDSRMIQAALKYKLEGKFKSEINCYGGAGQKELFKIGMRVLCYKNRQLTRVKTNQSQDFQIDVACGIIKGLADSY